MRCPSVDIYTCLYINQTISMDDHSTTTKLLFMRVFADPTKSSVYLTPEVEATGAARRLNLKELQT